tara:strand:- start:81 stop:221 length:141 start_codon:yes stop_codon:yes gene_type:complete
MTWATERQGSASRAALMRACKGGAASGVIDPFTVAIDPFDPSFIVN